MMERDGAGKAARMRWGHWLGRLALVLLVLVLTIGADLYLFALKKLRGSVLFPESY